MTTGAIHTPASLALHRSLTHGMSVQTTYPTAHRAISHTPGLAAVIILAPAAVRTRPGMVRILAHIFPNGGRWLDVPAERALCLAAPFPSQLMSRR